VLDLIDLFVKHQPTSPHVVRLIIPLVELITGTSSDEQQLSDKARGILASRIGKLKDVPPSIDTEQVVQIFDDAHNRARRNHYSDLAGLLSQCSLYLCKLLLHFGLDKPVIQAYHESLTDYATRKASTLNIAFFQDFVRRYPLNSWELRQAAIEASAKCINVFRQRHIFQLLQGILKQVSVTVSSYTSTTLLVETERQTVRPSARDHRLHADPSGYSP
jgi:DNA polymerase phi